MPEVHFEVRWPSGFTRRYYSPSTVVHQHFVVSTSYDVEDFLARAELAMSTASERVRAKYGYACSSALDTLAEIRETAATEARGASPPERKVTVLAME